MEHQRSNNCKISAMVSATGLGIASTQRKKTPAKLQELGGTVTRHTVADDLAHPHIERGEQRGRAMVLVVVGHGGSPALL
jgi:hypothetical protein